ncbi:N-acetyltransferase [[Acholeplasma] multilocale]|uniref:N-acetyltransferase n=1 Tax=[Acholeplasma] multilocale TaxID=264638 RepID=UPI00047B282C|nr:N-acetyltransferase [[Acholeplasma] multilocale]
MIRKFKKEDLETVANIWLNSNIIAHDFIDDSYWKSNFEMVKEMLPQSDLFVFEDNGIIKGFVGLEDNFILGLFVAPNSQGQGVGSQLLDFIKEIYPSLSLQVYTNNSNALNFYLKKKFKEVSRSIDKSTNQEEILMAWRK